MGEDELNAWRETDLARAIGVAKQAGLRSYRIEIAPDGGISIVVCVSPESAANLAACSAALSADG